MKMVEKKWELNIPKKLHVYWGGGKLLYLRYLTVKTFMDLNPDWEIIFLYPKQHTSEKSWTTYENKNTFLLGTDFLPELFSQKITKIEVDFMEYGISNSISEVHKSDFIRLIQLSTHGGLWSDMDIIYIRPMNDFYLNIKDNDNIETFICDNEYGHSIGFLMASKENKFFQKLYDLSKKFFQPKNYQSIGVRLYNHYFSTMDSIQNLTPAMNIHMSVVYPHVAGREFELINGTPQNFTDKTIGVHWFAGHPQWTRFLVNTNGGINNLPDCIISQIIKNAQIK